MRTFKFEELSAAPLIVDAIYEGGDAKNLQAEVLGKVFSAVDESGQVIRVQNVGGFRYRGSLPKPRLVVLTSNSSETAWPDSIDPFTGQLTYFGDNRSPGELHATPQGGNRILLETFSQFDQSSTEREKLPVFFYFTKWKGFSQQFRGLVVPGGVGVKTGPSAGHQSAVVSEPGPPPWWAPPKKGAWSSGFLSARMALASWVRRR